MNLSEALVKKILIEREERILLTVMTILEWLQQKINIKILYAETAGAANARNIGLRYASGNYICFLDDDDLISENYLMDLLEKVEKEKNAIVVSMSMLSAIA